MEWQRDDYRVSDDRDLIDVGVVHRFLATESYWARGVPEAIVARALEHSLCFGLYRGRAQVGFARVVTDRAVFAYLGDVFVDQAHRGRGLGKFLIECVMSHPDLQGLRRMSLVTSDAHELYRPFGFKPMADPTRYMEVHRPDVYKS